MQEDLVAPAVAPERTTRLARWKGALGGLALIGMAIFFIVGGVGLGLGQPNRLGTGAFPVLAGVVLIILAVGVIIEALTEDFDTETPDFFSACAISAGIAAFALIAPAFGLVPAVFCAVLASSLPDRSLPMVGKVVLGIVVALASWALFIGLLGLPFKPIAGF